MLIENVRELKPMDRLLYWITERHNIYIAKEAGKDKPWTDDTILQSYKFCNVYRELDKETVWIRKHWREPNSEHHSLWFAMCVARLVNWSPTLDELGYPTVWDRKYFVRTLNTLQRRGVKVWTGAYTISTCGQKVSKVDYIATVLDRLWGNRLRIGMRLSTKELASVYEGLKLVDGMGSFLSAQVVADLKYGYHLKDAKDWWTWAAPGPGSRRGLNRIHERKLTQHLHDDKWLAEVQLLRTHVNSKLPRGMEPLHAQDVQSVLCETDKYDRILFGQGRTRSRYDGAGHLED